jgi:hypothetical protein
MGKKSSRTRKGSIMKSIRKTTNKTLPVVNRGLKTVGKTTKDVTKASLPIIEKGVGAVYSTISSGLDLGIKGVKSMSSKATRKQLSRSRSSSRSRALAGGRRTKRRRH